MDNIQQKSQSWKNIKLNQYALWPPAWTYQCNPIMTISSLKSQTSRMECLGRFKSANETNPTRSGLNLRGIYRTTVTHISNPLPTNRIKKLASESSNRYKSMNLSWNLATLSFKASDWLQTLQLSIATVSILRAPVELDNFIPSGLLHSNRVISATNCLTPGRYSLRLKRHSIACNSKKLLKLYHFPSWQPHGWDRLSYFWFGSCWGKEPWSLSHPLEHMCFCPSWDIFLKEQIWLKKSILKEMNHLTLFWGCPRNVFKKLHGSFLTPAWRDFQILFIRSSEGLKGSKHRVVQIPSEAVVTCASWRCMEQSQQSKECT